MLFKFASYLLGTNNEEELKPEQQLNVESNENQDTQEQTSTSVNHNNSTSLSENENLLTNSNEKEVINLTNKQDLLAEYDDDYMYAEQLINCSKLKTSNFNFESSEDLIKEGKLGDQLEDDEDYEDDQWIYITPIKRKNEDEKENSDEDFSEQDDEEEENFEDEIISKANLHSQQEADKENERKEKFNFYDYFNNKTMNEDTSLSSIRSSKPTSSLNLSINKLKKINRMEESWIIHPPACFEIDNTFTIEEHPLENALLENPALSIIASCKSLEKENNNSTSPLTNSSLNNTSTANLVLVDRNFNNSQTKNGGKSGRKRTNSARKTNKKQTKKSKKPTKKNDLLVVKSVNQSAAKDFAEQKTNDDKNQEQVLNDRQLLVHYLMNPNQLNTAISTSNTIALSSNGSTHSQSTTNHYSHNHTHHHNISNNCVTNTQKNTSEQKKGSKSLKRNNKVVANRDNLSNRPFTLHRKLC